MKKLKERLVLQVVKGLLLCVTIVEKKLRQNHLRSLGVKETFVTKRAIPILERLNWHLVTNLLIRESRSGKVISTFTTNAMLPKTLSASHILKLVDMLESETPKARTLSKNGKFYVPSLMESVPVVMEERSSQKTTSFLYQPEVLIGFKTSNRYSAIVIAESGVS